MPIDPIVGAALIQGGGSFLTGLSEGGDEFEDEKRRLLQQQLRISARREGRAGGLAGLGGNLRSLLMGEADKPAITTAQLQGISPLLARLGGAARNRNLANIARTTGLQSPAGQLRAAQGSAGNFDRMLFDLTRTKFVEDQRKRTGLLSTLYGGAPSFFRT